MGFNLMFWKKHDDLDSLKNDLLKDLPSNNPPQQDQSLGINPEVTPVGVSNNSFGNPQQQSNPYNQNPYAQQSAFGQNTGQIGTYPQQMSQELISKNLEIVSAKLDALKVSIDSLNQRLNSIEEKLKNRW